MKAKRDPWYADGVRFECQPDCGKCCTRHGEYDYVYLERDDVERLADHFNLTVPEFRARWTKKDDGHTVLKMDGPACPFLEGTREDLSTFCPGVGADELIPLHVIRERLLGQKSS